MKQEIIDFINQHEDLIENNEWEHVYKLCAYKLRPQLTKLLNDADIHPEQYLDALPSYFCLGRDDNTSYTISNQCEAIGTSAFDGSRLEQIDLPTKLKYISATAFRHCNLRNIVLPDSVRSLGNGAFVGNRNLAELILNTDIVEIGSNVFANCPDLVLCYNGTIEQFHNVVKLDYWNRVDRVTQETIPVYCTNGVYH